MQNRVFRLRSVVASRATRAALAVLAFGLHGVAAAAVTVTVGIANTSSDVGFFIADKKGYFKQEGIEAKFIDFESAAKMVAPLGSGQLDVGGGASSAGLYNAAARGINIKIVADKGSIPPGYGFSSLLVRKDLIDSGKFKDYKDLKGLKVAIGAAGTSTASALNEALRRGGLKYKDVDVVYMGFPQHALAFANKAIDASITNEPTVTKAVQAGSAVRFAGNDVFYPNQQTAVVLYAGDFIKNKPDIAKKFMRAYIKAVRDYNDALKDGRLAGPNAPEVISILTEYTSIKDPNVHKSIVPNGCNPDGKVFQASLKKDLQFFKDEGLIQGDVSVERVLDNSFADAVVGELGPYKPRSK